MLRNLVRRALIVATLFLFPLGSNATSAVPVEEGSNCMIWFGGICGCAWIQSCPNYTCGDPSTGDCKVAADE